MKQCHFLHQSRALRNPIPPNTKSPTESIFTSALGDIPSFEKRFSRGNFQYSVSDEKRFLNFLAKTLVSPDGSVAWMLQISQLKNY
jgi:hypothetical protein